MAWYVLANDPLRQPLNDGGFANAWVANQDWIILGAAAKDSNHSL